MPLTDQPDPATIPSVQEERAQYGEEKPKAKDTARLIWASKPRKEPNPKDLEFQTAEEVYPNVADAKDRTLSTYATNGRKIAEQPNRLIWGDNLLVMQALLAQGYEGQIDLIYIDPPFNTGENFNFCGDVKIGDSTYEKELPVNERLAYTDTWSRGKDSFLDMIYPRLQLMRKLLSEKGSIYVHCDWRVNCYLRLIMDEIFGNDCFVNEIIWHYKTFQGQTHKYFAKKHDTLLLYSKSRHHVYNEQFDTEFEDTIDAKRWASYLNDNHQILGSNMPIQDSRFVRYLNKWIKENGRNPNPDDIVFEVLGQPIDTVWNIKGLDPKSLEKVGYPTQKPEILIDRIINASSERGDLVADFFCGSGTTGAVSEKLGRRWILSDISKTSIQITRSRLVNNNSNSFVIENLGNYQRQLIYAKEINLRQTYGIILKLYGAEPRADMHGFGRSKGDKNTLVYVCEPDRAMTAKKAIELAKMARTADGGYKNLVILAWDYDYEFDDAFIRMKRNLGKIMTDVEFKIIPSDVYKYLRSTKLGDPELAKKITFYQKPYIRIGEPEITSREGNSVSVKMKIEQYVVLDIPVKDESKRPEIEKCLARNFAYLIDYWTVDWDYNGDVFRSQWQAIRDRRGNEPVPVIAEKTLERGKRYTIAVRVVDVFGNDASGTKEIDLR